MAFSFHATSVPFTIRSSRIDITTKVLSLPSSSNAYVETSISGRSLCLNLICNIIKSVVILLRVLVGLQTFTFALADSSGGEALFEEEVLLVC